MRVNKREKNTTKPQYQKLIIDSSKYHLKQKKDCVNFVPGTKRSDNGSAFIVVSQPKKNILSSAKVAICESCSFFYTLF